MTGDEKLEMDLRERLKEEMTGDELKAQEKELEKTGRNINPTKVMVGLVFRKLVRLKEELNNRIDYYPTLDKEEELKVLIKKINEWFSYKKDASRL